MVRRSAQALVLVAPGTNMDREMVTAFEMAGAVTTAVHINDLITRKMSLAAYNILVIPGGFSFGDDIASGRVLVNKIKSHLLKEFLQFVADGNLVLGVCNGFQVLVKMGLLPNLRASLQQETTLTVNDTARYEDRWVHLLPNPATPCIFTRGLRQPVYLPIAHGEGRFVTKDVRVLQQLRDRNQVVFQYSDATGKFLNNAQNPNGSVANIAGICDATGRIFGMMPHPERYVHRLQHPRWTRDSLPDVGEGMVIFQNAVEYALNEL